MADPRLGYSIIGKNAEYAGFKYDNSTITYAATSDGGSAVVGRAVTYDDTATEVKLTEDGEEVVGKLIKVEPDGRCVVQIGGGMTLPGGTGASLTLGKKIVGDLLGTAKGYIREVATGTAAELGVARGWIHDADTTTAVEVYLD